MAAERPIIAWDRLDTAVTIIILLLLGLVFLKQPSLWADIWLERRLAALTRRLESPFARQGSPEGDANLPQSMPPDIAAAREIEGSLSAIMNERDTLKADWMICPKLVVHQLPTKEEQSLMECFTTTQDWMRMAEEATSRSQALVGVFATFRNRRAPPPSTGSSSSPNQKMRVWAVVYRDMMARGVAPPMPTSKRGWAEDQKENPKPQRVKELVIFDPAMDGLRRALHSRTETPIQQWFSGFLIPDQQALIRDVVARTRLREATPFPRAWIGGNGDDFQDTGNRGGDVVVAWLRKALRGHHAEFPSVYEDVEALEGDRSGGGDGGWMAKGFWPVVFDESISTSSPC
ncbi:uncharacterized protein BP5553_07602 [Venustampulla echinocandica]|uniref:Uncharacterized protein n=1 Tax=Venustampulla echinocandica TaxID=2656787 RepID=A0A370TGZ9_9HELO|nr:uncharacterized protein BP5553_07602 [Venustampulla echinocandica]RDL34474.1 hypothetical protein BP5553_07602 [Venustampulla echinocandica]